VLFMTEDDLVGERKRALVYSPLMMATMRA
jgi:hypothetical protein